MSEHEITSYAPIDKSLLSGTQYTLSLLSAANEAGILSDDDVGMIQVAAVERLGEKVRLFTHGESTSIRNEIAEQLMTSVLYTVGVTLKAMETPEIAAAALRDRPFRELYDEGVKRIGRKCAMIRKLGDYLKTARVPVKDAYYRQATEILCDRFLDKYDRMYMAMDAPTPDYPLFVPVKDAVGVEYMQKYFENLYRETQLMRLFDGAAVARLTLIVNRIQAPMNLLRPILVAALSSLLLSRDPRSLTGGSDAVGMLTQRFENKDAAYVARVLSDALSDLADMLGFSSPALLAYLREGLRDVAQEIVFAIRNGTPQTVFRFADGEAEFPRVRFDFGTRMDDDAYSAVAYKVGLCEMFDEQRALIREKIRSMYDLEDIIRDIPFSDRETAVFIGELEPNELAFLLKKHPYPDEVDKIGMADGEIRLCRVLRDTIAALPPEKQSLIEKLSLLISDDVYSE